MAKNGKKNGKKNEASSFVWKNIFFNPLEDFFWEKI